MSIQLDSGRLNISLPKKTLVALAAAVPERGKSNFITQAIEEKLERVRWETAFKKLSTLPPTLTHIADPISWVDGLRHEDEQRLERQRL